MADSLWMRLREVPWSDFKTNTGSKPSIPKILENLSSRKEARAMKASHDLWSALCSGGVSPAAEPTIPFLVEIFDISSDAVQEELLDIFIKLAQAPAEDALDWQKNIFENMCHYSVFIDGIRHSNNEALRKKANIILELIS